jgi:glycosyltransferase involved in cell wall biosynthesis
MSRSPGLLRLTLVTEGDPEQLTGGYLYQQRMAQAAAQHEAQVRFLAVPRRPFPIGTIDVRRELRPLADPDVLVVDSIVAALAAPWLRRVTRRTPVVGLVHQQPGGADHGPLRAAVQRRLDLQAYRQARRVIVVSDFLAERLGADGIPPESIVVATPGRDPSGRQQSVTGDELRRGRQAALLCVSNWLPNKSVHLLLEAVARLQERMATLHLVGEPSLDAGYARRLRTRIGAADLRERVIVHGAKSPPEVAGLMAAADVLVHPSRHEAYGSAVAEAMAAGLPVVAFAVDNLPNLVRDGIDGILVPFGQIPSLTAAIAVLVGDPARRATVGAAARARATTWPTWAQSADRFFDAVREIARG